MRLAGWLLVAAALAGCHHGPSLRIEVHGIAPTAAGLTARLSFGGTSRSRDFGPPLGGFACDEAFTVELRDDMRGATLHVDVSAIDRGGRLLAESATDVRVVDGAMATVALSPAVCGPGDAGAPVDGGGLVFSESSAPTNGADLFAIAVDVAQIYVVGEGVALRSPDGAPTNWSSLFALDATRASWYGVWAHDRTIVGVGAPDTIEVSTDGGGSSMNLGGSGAFGYEAIAAGTNSIFVAGAGGRLLVSRDGGGTFQPAGATKTSALLRAVVPLPGLLVAVGDGDVLCRSLDDGKTFDVTTIGPGNTSLAAITGIATDLWAGGDTALYHSSDGMAVTWAPASTQPPVSDIRALYRDAQGGLWVGGFEGIALSTDGARSWQLRSTAQPIYAVAGTPAGDVWAVGRGGLVLHHAP